MGVIMCITGISGTKEGERLSWSDGALLLVEHFCLSVNISCFNLLMDSFN